VEDIHKRFHDYGERKSQFIEKILTKRKRGNRIYVEGLTEIDTTW